MSPITSCVTERRGRSGHHGTPPPLTGRGRTRSCAGAMGASPSPSSGFSNRPRRWERTSSSSGAERLRSLSWIARAWLPAGLRLTSPVKQLDVCCRGYRSRRSGCPSLSSTRAARRGTTAVRGARGFDLGSLGVRRKPLVRAASLAGRGRIAFCARGGGLVFVANSPLLDGVHARGRRARGGDRLLRDYFTREPGPRATRTAGSSSST